MLTSSTNYYSWIYLRRWTAERRTTLVVQRPSGTLISFESDFVVLSFVELRIITVPRFFFCFFRYTCNVPLTEDDFGDNEYACKKSSMTAIFVVVNSDVSLAYYAVAFESVVVPVRTIKRYFTLLRYCVFKHLTTPSHSWRTSFDPSLCLWALALMQRMVLRPRRRRRCCLCFGLEWWCVVQRPVVKKKKGDIVGRMSLTPRGYGTCERNQFAFRVFLSLFIVSLCVSLHDARTDASRARALQRQAAAGAGSIDDQHANTYLNPTDFRAATISKIYRAVRWLASRSLRFVLQHLSSVDVACQRVLY